MDESVVAIFGARPCELAALDVLDRVLDDEIVHHSATDEDWEARRKVLAASSDKIHGTLDTTGLPDLLECNLEHPRWDEARR